MRTGLYTAAFHNLSFEEALDRAAALGVSAVEISTGGYAGANHCPIDELLSSAERRREYLDSVAARDLDISILTCHCNLLSPDPDQTQQARRQIEQTLRLAGELGVPAVNLLSGLPAGAPGDKVPNWITCPWPAHFLTALDYQWNTIAIPTWQYVGSMARQLSVRLAIEMLPGQLVYNVETLLRLRAAAGENLGCNFDPSHLFWNGVDAVAAIRALGKAIYHVHAKDVYIDPLNVAVNGCNDAKPYQDVAGRAWTFRSVGYGHGEQVWRDIVSALRTIGYDYVMSIEHEDPLISVEEGIRKSVELLKRVCITEPADDVQWA